MNDLDKKPARGHRALDRALNLITLIVVVGLAGTVAKRHLERTEPLAAGALPSGMKISVANVNWTANKQTLLFVVQAGCIYCKASVGFYRDVIRSNSRNAFHPIIVIPGPVADGEAFAKSHDLAIADVREGDFAELNVTGTPTLLLVGSDGRLEASWVGKLTPKQEEDVFRTLKTARPASSGMEAHGIGAAQTGELSPITSRQFATSFAGAPVVDTRDRPEFETSHIAGALNIPLDELEARASHEVPVEADVVVYCRLPTRCAVPEEPIAGVPSTCEVGVNTLRRGGFQSLFVLADDRAQLEAAGVTVVKRPMIR